MRLTVPPADTAVLLPGNFYQGDITQAIMEANMRALAARTRTTKGRTGNVSLLDIGYARCGLDDNWQACGTGLSGSFHSSSGQPLINRSRFPDMKSMVDLGHSLGLAVGWYDNNCICGEGSAHLHPDQVATDVAGDVGYIASIGFDGLKADGCGPGRDLPSLARQLNATGRKILIENCHYYKWPNSSMPVGTHPDRVNRIWPYWRDNVTGGELMCEEHLFRASGDIRNSWGSWFGNLASLEPYQDEAHPISQPGCWAYADMLMVGVFANDHAPRAGAALSTTEWRSHFGAWCINSSPLVLSFDLTNRTTMEAVWPFIANVEAIAVNQGWAGHPGRRVTTGNSSYAVWKKPLPQSRVAVLVVSMLQPGSPKIDMGVDLSTVAPGCASQECAVLDVWKQQDAGHTQGSTYPVRGLAGHDSAFLIFEISGAGRA